MSNINDFIIEDGVLTKYVGQGGDVVIPDCVTSIGKEAFNECETVLSITIGDNVESIGKAAFMSCINLKHVMSSKNTLKFDMFVFANCLRLESVIIPPSVKEIGGFSFMGCPGTVIIRGECGSYAEKYAKLYKITFESITF